VGCSLQRLERRVVNTSASVLIPADCIGCSPDDEAPILRSLVVSARTNAKAMMGKLALALFDVVQAGVDLTVC
jgi:hypothetical protein